MDNARSRGAAMLGDAPRDGVDDDREAAGDDGTPSRPHDARAMTPLARGTSDGPTPSVPAAAAPPDQPRGGVALLRRGWVARRARTRDPAGMGIGAGSG